MVEIADAELKAMRVELKALRGEVNELRDRQEILDVMHRYARTFDRHDWALINDVYHADAIDDHGRIICGPHILTKFFEKRYNEMFTLQEHLILNHTADIEGDTAHSETYFVASCILKDGKTLETTRGRYLDRLEKRADRKWRIAHRRVVVDATIHAAIVSQQPPQSRRGRDDPSYYKKPFNLRSERAELITTSLDDVRPGDSR